MWLHYIWYRIKLGATLLQSLRRCSLDKGVAHTMGERGVIQFRTIAIAFSPWLASCEVKHRFLCTPYSLRGVPLACTTVKGTRLHMCMQLGHSLGELLGEL